MVISGLIIKFPYWLCWQVRRLFNQLNDVVFYVESEHDYFVIENILPHIEFQYSIVARNREIAKHLRQRGIQVDVWPAFPKLLIMTRHAFHRFPIKGIKTIGMKHGTYHFKKMIHPKKYNAFDLYFFSTDHEAELAAKAGIKCGVVGGQPKLDSLYQKETLEISLKIKQQPEFDTNKKTLLFTATWDKSGLSAIEQWIDKLPGLKTKYNILVSLHPMMSINYVNKVKSMPGVYFADAYNLPAFMLAADFLISDTSSVMGEFCALDKPIITFYVDEGWRLTHEIREMIKNISVQIKNINELDQAIKKYIKHPDLKKTQRRKWRQIFYGDVNASHGKKTAKIINSFVLKHIN